jgi:hypothetical protein
VRKDRKTDRGSISTSLRARHLAAPALAFALVASAAAQVAAPTASVEATSPYAIALHRAADTRGAATVTISGTWPTPCTPTYESARLAGADLRVDARTTLNLCAHQPTPFAIEIDPAAAADRALPFPGVLHVSFFAANGTQAEPKLRAFALVEGEPGRPAFAPENGFWWTTSTTRQSASRNVVSLERQGTQLTAALMSYDHDGRGNWQFGTATLEGRVAHIPLLQLAGGSDPFAAASTAPHGEAGLMLDIEFRSSAVATAWLSRRGVGDDAALELQTMDLVRLPFADAGDGSAWKGDWILVADSEQTPPLRVRFDRVSPLDATRFRLSDEAAGVVMDCENDTRNAELPPQYCAAQRADGTPLGRFNSVAITRMDGTRVDGSGVHLMRVTP